MSSVNKDSFISSFPIDIIFISFSYLNVLHPHTVSKRSGERGHPSFVPDLSWKASSLFHLSMVLALQFFVDILYPVEKVLLYF